MDTLLIVFMAFIVAGTLVSLAVSLLASGLPDEEEDM